MIQKFIRNDYALSVFSKISAMVIGLISSAFLTRYLGIKYKGEYAFIIQAISVAGLILNLGIYQSYTYYYRKRGDVVFNDYLSISTFQFCLYSILCIILSIIIKTFVWEMIFLMIPFQVFRLQMDNIMLVQNVRGRLKTNILSSILLMFFYAVLFFFFDSNILPVVIAVIISDIFIIGNYFRYERHHLKIKCVDWSFAKSVLRFGLLPMVSALLVTLNYSVDIFFLKKIGIPDELSIYSVAAGIMNYVWLVPDAFKDIIFSRVARNDQKSSVAFSTKISLTFLVITTIGFLILGRLFIYVMYGEEFIKAYGVTIVLFLGVFSMIFFKIFGIVLIAEGKRVPYFCMLLVSVVLNIILNYLLIPVYGMYGAAYASVGSYNVCGIMFLLYFSKEYNIPIKQLVLINKSDLKLITSFLKNNK